MFSKKYKTQAFVVPFRLALLLREFSRPCWLLLWHTVWQIMIYLVWNVNDVTAYTRRSVIRQTTKIFSNPVSLRLFRYEKHAGCQHIYKAGHRILRTVILLIKNFVKVQSPPVLQCCLSRNIDTVTLYNK